jgi:hypothetical protein
MAPYRTRIIIYAHEAGKGQIEQRHETDGIRTEHIASLLNP